MPALVQIASSQEGPRPFLPLPPEGKRGLRRTRRGPSLSPSNSSSSSLFSSPLSSSQHGYCYPGGEDRRAAGVGAVGGRVGGGIGVWGADEGAGAPEQDGNDRRRGGGFSSEDSGGGVSVGFAGIGTGSAGVPLTCVDATEGKKMAPGNGVSGNSSIDNGDAVMTVPCAASFGVIHPTWQASSSSTWSSSGGGRPLLKSDHVNLDESRYCGGRVLAVAGTPVRGGVPSGHVSAPHRGGDDVLVSEQRRVESNQMDSSRNVGEGGVELTLEQKRVMQLAEMGCNIFIGGAAGSGKTFLLRHLLGAMRRMHGDDAVSATASTGFFPMRLLFAF